MDSIEPEEQLRINGKGNPPVPLTELKKDNAAKSWLFEKYYDMCFVDKNPEEDNASADPLEDENEWEHRVIKDVVWWKKKGYAVETLLWGDVVDQSVERYQINEVLLQMIRNSPHNSRVMYSSSVDRVVVRRDGDDDDQGDNDSYDLGDDSDSQTHDHNDSQTHDHNDSQTHDHNGTSDSDTSESDSDTSDNEPLSVMSKRINDMKKQKQKSNQN